MSITADFHYDFGSPNTYLCHRVLPEISSRTGANFNYVPILLGGVFKATNNKSPMEQFGDIKNKMAYQSLETQRFIKKHELSKYVFNSNFPINTLPLMRGAVFCSDKDYYHDYIEAVYQAMWEQNLNMGDESTIVSVLQNANLPVDDIVAGTQNPDIKQQLIENTTKSVEQGNFGSPTFYVGSEMFFGKDRLRELEEEIVAQQS